MKSVYCYDGERWLTVMAPDMNLSENKMFINTWLTTDIDQTALNIEDIDEDEYIEMQCQAICRCKLQRGKAYVVALGDNTIRCGGLIFSDTGIDQNGYKYFGFFKNGHPVWVYMGNPKLLLVPQSPN